MSRAAALFALLAAPWALAQDVHPERLYLNPSGVLLGSTRVTALGGAFVGVAEGAEGFTSNLAALAHRSHRLDRAWDVGFTASWLDLPFVTPARQDLDNDGTRDQAQETRQFQLGLLLQLKQFGLGWHIRTTSLTFCKVGLGPCPGSSQQIAVNVSTQALAGAVALGHDDFIAALGLFWPSASFTGFMDRPRYYSDIGVEFDVLYRESKDSCRMMVLCLHPLLTGRPALLQAFDGFLTRMSKFEGLWFARCSDIATWWTDHEYWI